MNMMQEKMLDKLIDLFTGMDDGDETKGNPDAEVDEALGKMDANEPAKAKLEMLAIGTPKQDEKPQALPGKDEGVLAKLKGMC